jgi:hypothetical protein
MTKKLQKYFSLIKEIQTLQDELTNLVEKEKPVKTIDDKLLINIIKEFPKASISKIAQFAINLVDTTNRITIEKITRKIWSMIDRGIVDFDENRNLVCNEDKKKTRKPKVQPPYLGDPVWESKNEMSMNLLNIVDSIKK